MKLIIIFNNYHNKKGLISVKRVIQEIKSANYYWKTIHNDCNKLYSKIPVCLKMKGGKVIKPVPIQIKTQGPLERVVMEGWKLHNELANVSCFK